MLSRSLHLWHPLMQFMAHLFGTFFEVSSSIVASLDIVATSELVSAAALFADLVKKRALRMDESLKFVQSNRGKIDKNE